MPEIKLGQGPFSSSSSIGVGWCLSAMAVSFQIVGWRLLRTLRTAVT
jgi:hypothetical protein